MGEVQNAEQLEVTLLTRKKLIINKLITLDLLIKDVILTQQCFVLPITSPIILGSEFLDAHFAFLDIGFRTINLCCADYMLTTGLTVILFIISTL